MTGPNIPNTIQNKITGLFCKNCMSLVNLYIYILRSKILIFLLAVYKFDINTVI